MTSASSPSPHSVLRSAAPFAAVEDWRAAADIVPPEGCVVTVGVFDGLHRGHAELVRRTVEQADAQGAAAAVLTFAQHPLTLLAPPYAPKRLLTPERKAELLARAGVRVLVSTAFDRAFAQQPAGEFVASVLCGVLRARAVVCGHDFAFGFEGRGNVELLRAEGAARGFEVIEVPAILQGGVLVKSTAIRELVYAGKMRRAGRLLGRPFEWTGVVESGAGRGRQLGFSTANLPVREDYVVPKAGVYACEAILADGARVPAITNIGVAPTFGGTALAIESHLIGWSGDLVGQPLRVEFFGRLRDETKFAGPEQLKAQLVCDREAGLAVLASEDARLLRAGAA